VTSLFSLIHHVQTLSKTPLDFPAVSVFFCVFLLTHTKWFWKLLYFLLNKKLVRLRPLFIVSKKRNQKHFLLNSYSKFLLWTSYRVLLSKNSTENVFSISYSPIRRRKLHQILTRFSVFFSEKDNDERDENAMLESDLSGDFSAV